MMDEAQYMDLARAAYSEDFGVDIPQGPPEGGVLFDKERGNVLVYFLQPLAIYAIYDWQSANVSEAEAQEIYPHA